MQDKNKTLLGTIGSVQVDTKNKIELDIKPQQIITASLGIGITIILVFLVLKFIK